MAYYRDKNWAVSQPDLADGDVVECCNLFQAKPHTVLTSATGKHVTFRDCNLVNIEVDGAWAIEGCNTAQVEFCTNERPDLINYGLKKCAVDCAHRSATKVEVEILEDEYREQHAADLANVRIETPAADLLGISVEPQKFFHTRYVYQSKQVK